VANYNVSGPLNSRDPIGIPGSRVWLGEYGRRSSFAAGHSRAPMRVFLNQSLSEKAFVRWVSVAYPLPSATSQFGPFGAVRFPFNRRARSLESSSVEVERSPWGVSSRGSSTSSRAGTTEVSSCEEIRSKQKLGTSGWVELRLMGCNPYVKGLRAASRSDAHYGAMRLDPAR
jgi:hypothetical protein